MSDEHDAADISGDLQARGVDRVHSIGLTVEKVGHRTELHETVLRRWVKQFSVQATGTARRPITQAPAPSPSDLVSEVARLRRENERLRMDRDILKKAALTSSDRLPMKFGFRR